MSADLLNGASSRDTGRGGVLLPEGFYPQLRLVKAELFRQFSGSKPRTFTCDLEVIEGPAQGTILQLDGTRSLTTIFAGQVGSGPYEQLENNPFPDQDKKSAARTMLFLGALFGYSDPDVIDANIKGVTLGQVTSDLQPCTGVIFSARVTHTQTKPKPNKPQGSIIQQFSEIAPVLENGKPKVIRGKGQQQSVSAPVAPVAAPVAVAPPAPPPAAPAAPAIPPGWAVHPNDKRWRYEIANPANMIQL